MRNDEPPSASGEDSGLSALGFPDPATPATARETALLAPLPADPHPSAPPKRSLRSRSAVSDQVFRGVARSGGLLVLTLMLMVGTFLAFRAAQALRKPASP